MYIPGVITFSILSIIMLITIIFAIIKSDNKEDIITYTFIGMLYAIIVFALIKSIIYEPLAIDVYRNKTELVIKGEYKDSIFVATDSVVVYKNN